MPRALVVLLAAAALSTGQQRTDQWVALRYDDQRVLFYFAANNKLVADPPLGASVPPPVAKYNAGDGLHELSLARFDKMKIEPEVLIAIGDRYELMLGGNRVSQVEVERLVELPTCTDIFIGAIARVTGGADAFRTAREKYYVVRQKPGEPLPDRVSAVTGVASTLDSRLLAANVTSRMQIDLKKVITAYDPVFDRPEYAAKLRRWKALDQRLAEGGGELSYEVQSVRLAGILRYYVKAQWVIQGSVRFLMTAWLLPDLSIESANSKMSALLRMAEFEDSTLTLADLPKILNVFSDGSLLVTDEGYESFSVSLYRYTPDGLKETGVSFGYGC